MLFSWDFMSGAIAGTAILDVPNVEKYERTKEESKVEASNINSE